MATRNTRKRRRSPVDYKLLHEEGKRRNVSNPKETSSSEDSSEDECSSGLEDNADMGSPTGRRAGTPYYFQSRQSKYFCSDTFTDSTSESRDSDDSCQAKEYESESDYGVGPPGRDSSSDSDSDGLPDPFIDLPNIRRQSRVNRSNIFCSTRFSETESDSGLETERHINDLVDNLVKSGGRSSPAPSKNPVPDSEGKKTTEKNAGKTDGSTLKSTGLSVPLKPCIARKMADPNSSSYWRELGNQIYITAHENLSPVIRRERLRQATNHYYKAYNFSRTEDEKVSASKNLGMASWRMAQVEEKVLERLSVLMYFYKEAFKYLSLAYRDSEEVKPQNWRDNLLASAKTCWEEMKSGRIDEIPVDERKTMFHDIVQCVQIQNLKAEVYIHLGGCHFHSGITALQKGDYKKAIYEMKECYMPLHEARNCGKGIMSIEAEARILEDDVMMHTCMSESIQAREIGDGICRQVMLDEENLQMDMVYDMIDWYKQAILRTREVTEVELEAIALSRMGRVYDKILKLKYKAKEYLMRSIQLAHSMHPRTFHGEDWFTECSEILERYQKETVQEEEAKWQKEREGLLKELSKEMKDIDTHDKKSGEEFLKFVYRVFPPKNPEHKLIEVPRKKDARLEHPVLKKILQKAIVHYHPDRVDADKHGKTWKVLAEEITKCLTRRYECLKG